METIEKERNHLLELIECLKKQEPDRPVCELWNWFNFGYSLMGDVRNHPRLGNQDGVRTSRLKYLNEEIGVAVTQNTVYVLKDKAQ